MKKANLHYKLMMVIATIAISFNIYSQSCPVGVVGYWKMDETSGTNLADEIANNDATRNATTGNVSGIIDNSQRFTFSYAGTYPNNYYTDKEYAEVPNNAAFNFGKDASFTISYWVKMRDCGVGFQDHIAISKGDWNGGGGLADGMFASGFNGSCRINFLLRDNTGYKIDLEGPDYYDTEIWYHVACVRDDASNKNILYVNGEITDQETYNYAGGFSNSMDLYFGSLVNFGDPQYIFKGDLDEVAIFNRALDVTEINEIITNAGSDIGICTPQSAPVVTSTAITSATEDIAYSYTFTVNDADAGDVLTLSAPTKPTWLSFSWTAGQKTAVLSGTPLNVNVGTHNVVLRVTDGNTPVDQSFTITVANVNDAPFITSTEVTAVNQDALYSYTLTVSDVDVSDVITMSQVTLPSWLTFNWTAGTKTATISGTPAGANVGSNPVDISISDGTVTIHESYTINVLSVAAPPVITGQTAVSINEDVDVTILKSHLTIVDQDPLSDITIKVLTGTNYTFQGNTVTPDADFNGQLTVNVKAYDLSDSSAIFPLIINVTPVADAPIFTSEAILEASVGNPYIYVFAASDGDDDALTFTDLLIPNWINFSATSKIISGLPVNADKGQHLVILQVSDGIHNVTQTFTINVIGDGAISEVKNNEFVIYPVPVNNKLNIRFNILTEETTIDIISTTGSIVESMIVPANTDIATISTEKMDAGFYICHIRNNTINLTSRFLIVK